MRIYRFGCDFYAAKNLRSAIREWVSCSCGSVREALEDVETLTDQQMNAFVFYDDVYNQDESTKRTFREQLNKMIESGEQFPQAFASSEY